MIEFRRIGGNFWEPHTGKNRISDFHFAGFHYRIFGEVHKNNTPKFRKAFNKYLIWRELSA